MQGEINYFGFIVCLQVFVDVVGLKWDLYVVLCYGYQVLCYLNFWVGIEWFWDVYVGGVLDLFVMFFEWNLDDEVVCVVMGDIWYSDVVLFLLFIVECLFSIFLLLCLELKVVVYQFDDVLFYCLIDYECEFVDGMRLIVDVVDVFG